MLTVYWETNTKKRILIIFLCDHFRLRSSYFLVFCFMFLDSGAQLVPNEQRTIFGLQWTLYSFLRHRPVKFRWLYFQKRLRSFIAEYVIARVLLSALAFVCRIKYILGEVVCRFQTQEWSFPVRLSFLKRHVSPKSPNHLKMSLRPEVSPVDI